MRVRLIEVRTVLFMVYTVRLHEVPTVLFMVCTVRLHEVRTVLFMVCTVRPAPVSTRVRNRETHTSDIRLIRDGRRWGKREIIYLSLHCHHQNDSYIKMGSDESQFNVSLIVREIPTRRCPQTTTFSKKKENRSRIEPNWACLLISLTAYR